jgi:uncharacterized protein YjbI with pentapeptide repeats
MNTYPDFSQHGYQAIAELGRNREAGRITYKANALLTNRQVVIKEFRFAASGANWSGFKAYEREIAIIQQISHSRIPRYLDSFETPQGFCLVQEYKNAPSLAERNSFNPEEVKQIAVSVLEILLYLQQRVPPIIHRDIKPENILVDEQLNAYLVDFGFARIRSEEVALSSVAAGTPGFMPPEEMFNRPLTEASDLYSLGVTLIGLLTGTRSVDIGKLIDDNYRLNFKSKVTQINPAFINWLQKMVAPNVKERFSNAAVALKALKLIKIVNAGSGRKAQERAIKLIKPAAVLGLATLSAIALLGTAKISYQKGNDVTRLLETKACERCDFHGADLRGANLGNANLQQSNLQFANLEFANLGNANLRDIYLDGAKLGSANLGSANLEFAKLGNADLGSANLGSANLRGAYLNGANLENANLRGANLSSTTLVGANLRGANLEGANLRGAYLPGANLEGANLNGANFKRANLKDAIAPDGTIHKYRKLSR